MISIEGEENNLRPFDISSQLRGNFLLFYAYDIGDEIFFEALAKERLLDTYIAPLPPYFKGYHVPLSFDLASCHGADPHRTRDDCISSKLHSFGVISLCYKIPFHDSFENLKIRFIDILRRYDERSLKDAKMVFERIKRVVAKPSFYNLMGRYSAVQIAPVAHLDPGQVKRHFGFEIASILRHEKESLSSYQTEAILADSTGYYGQDMVVIDAESAFIYDDDYFEVIEFLESANIQQLELRYFDRFLDQKLNEFYIGDREGAFSWISYIPMVRGKEEKLVEDIARLRVDISVIAERLEIGIKMSGDPYYDEMYSKLITKLLIREWQESITKKLSIVQDFYEIHSDRLGRSRDEILSIVIIILVLVEAIVAVLHFWGS